MTFAIAALCRGSGEFGGALATSSMAAGGRAAPLVSAGIGVVLSQARSDPRLGTIGLRSLEAGRSAEEALAEMIASTPHADWRQLAVLDSEGRATAYTGMHCTTAKGHRIGRDAIAAGNGLANEGVVHAMLEGFEAAADESLTDRLLKALEHGAAAGGELFPLRSAVIRVAQPGVPFPPIDLRIDYSETPIADLRKLWVLWAPMVAGYVQRCLDPAHSPPAANIEGHAPAAKL